MHEVLAKGIFDRDLAALTPQYAERLQWTVNCQAFPILDITAAHTVPIRLRFTCDNWNELPPSIEILNPDGTPWVQQVSMGSSVFHQSNHPTTGLRFICMRGSREFHTHTSHLNESWENYRDLEGMNLLGLMQQLVKHWRGNIK